MSSKSNKNLKNTKKVQSKKEKNDDKNRIVFLLVTVVLFIIILISTIFTDLQQIAYNKEQTELLKIKYTQLLEEEASLSSEAIKLQDPDYLARRAREKYLYTKDGEKILTIIEKEEKKEETK